MKLENTVNTSCIGSNSEHGTRKTIYYFQRHRVNLTDEMMEKACTYIDFVAKCEYMVTPYSGELC